MTTQLEIKTPASYRAEREYVIDVLVNDFLGLRHTIAREARDDVAIALAGDDSGRRLVLPDALFAIPPSDWLTPASLPETPLERWDVSGSALEPDVPTPPLPVLFGGRLANGSFLEVSEAGLRLGLDIFGSAFFMLTRYEEAARPERDALGRFPGGSSIADREGFLRRPVVNEYLEVLWAALTSLWPRLERKRGTFRERATHDVDWPLCGTASLRGVLKRALGEAVLGRDPILARDRLVSSLHRRRGRLEDDLCYTFDFIMDVGEEHGVQSSFNFITDHTGGLLDGSYSMDDPLIRGLLRRIHGRGHEIGLHPSYETFLNAEQTRAEFDELKRACEEEAIQQSSWGGRQHFLRWENPTTWQNWEEAGLDYDSTLGYPERVGFRCGVCFEYPVFNLRTRKRLRLRERPLVVMEMSLFGDRPVNFERALGREHERARADIAELKEACRVHGGEFVFLWHNSRLVSRRARAVYRQAVGGS
jgi:hypothetical protein